MGDEEDPWGADDSEEVPEPVVPTAVAAVPEGQTSTTEPSAEEGQVESIAEVAPPPPPVEDDGYRKPVQLYRHWVR